MEAKTQIRIGSVAALINPLLTFAIALSLTFAQKSGLSVLIIFFVFLIFSPHIVFLIALIKRKLLLARVFFGILFLQYLWALFLTVLSKEDHTLFAKAGGISLCITSILLFWLGLHGLKRLIANEYKYKAQPKAQNDLPA